jgi:hypothetical protein
MPDFSLPGVVRMETLRRGDLQADCLSCTPYAAECSQPLNSAKNRLLALTASPHIDLIPPLIPVAPVYSTAYGLLCPANCHAHSKSHIVERMGCKNWIVYY